MSVRKVVSHMQETQTEETTTLLDKAQNTLPMELSYYKERRESNLKAV